MVGKLPNVRIAGENNNALLAVQRLLEKLHTIKYLQKEIDNAWKHHAVTDESLSCLAQSVMKTINPKGVDEMDDDEEETILAFKTIRFVGDLWNTKGEDQWSDVTQAVDLIKTRFPCSRVIVNIRSNTTTLAQSRNSFKGFKTVTEDDLLDETRMLREVARQFGEQAYLLDSSEWTDPVLGVDKINGMIEWLGYKDCVFHQLIHDNWGDMVRDETSDSVELGQHCQLASVVQWEVEEETEQFLRLEEDS